MDQMNEFESAELEEASQLWTGSGVCRWPQECPDAVISRFGSERGQKLLSIFNSLFAHIWAEWKAGNLAYNERGELAAEIIRGLAPQLPASAVARIVNLFFFGSR
jgi:hypothetical protein